jgi:hypothetical protein
MLYGMTRGGRDDGVSSGWFSVYAVGKLVLVSCDGYI